MALINRTLSCYSLLSPLAVRMQLHIGMKLFEVFTAAGDCSIQVVV
jgi:hypothetical protein